MKNKCIFSYKRKIVIVENVCVIWKTGSVVLIWLFVLVFLFVCFGGLSIEFEENIRIYIYNNTTEKHLHTC